MSHNQHNDSVPIIVEDDDSPVITRKVEDNSKNESKIESYIDKGWSALWSRAQKVSDIAKTVIAKSKDVAFDVTKEIQKSIDEEFKLKKETVKEESHETYLAPWEELETDEQSAEEIKNFILSISANERHFLNGPKINEKILIDENKTFDFDLNTWLLTARASIRKDKNLHAMREKLVPKHISEYNFWRIYFYKIAVIKSSYNLDFSPRKKQTPSELKNTNISSQNELDCQTSSNGTSVVSLPNNENLDTAIENTQSENLNNDESIDWDQEFQEELNKLGISNPDTLSDQEAVEDLDEELKRAMEL